MKTTTRLLQKHAQFALTQEFMSRDSTWSVAVRFRIATISGDFGRSMKFSIVFDILPLRQVSLKRAGFENRLAVSYTVRVRLFENFTERLRFWMFTVTPPKSR